MRTLVIATLLLAAPATGIADTPSDAPIEIGVPELAVTELDVRGGVDRSLVQRVLDDTQRAMSPCRRKAQVTQIGTVTLKFRIDDSGAVSNVSATGVPNLNACIASAIKALAFDAPPRGKADILEKLALRTQAYLGSMVGTTDLSSGFDDDNVHGDLIGLRGGGGAGTAGHGRKSGWVEVGDPSAPAIDREMIRARVEHAISNLEACYEAELTARPELSGLVTVKFRIEPSGKVSSATGSGLAKVDACVASAIAAIEFAGPRSGGIDVSFPFVLVSSARRDLTSAMVTIGQPSAKGDLDKAIIRRYIKRHIQQFRYCYERELLAAPKLAGTVTVRFQIDASGKVSAATATGLAKVDECVAGTVQTIEFPKPPNGSSVDVTYPFVFQH
ncbi:MAG TPA: AgmX/PglI C-terminal domain-containing protein [Kofleriaceae bacterium]|nr:AgmX/PglI C-terminal domain-containing protein [Kofleriaceae bacterium]